MAFNLNTSVPLSLSDWILQYPTFSTQDTKTGYQAYLRAWYQQQPITIADDAKQLRQQYIQLLQELAYLFEPGETDLFLTDIDWTNNEDIILAVPLYAQKLKEISQVLVNKREDIKQARQKYNFIGSNLGLETLLYQYILNGFTKQNNHLTHIPYSTLRTQIPSLSSIGSNFRIELEELYDAGIYFDSDPAMAVSAYNIGNLGQLPFETLSVDQLNQILSTRFLSKVSNTPISLVYQSLQTAISANPNGSASISLLEQSRASQRYLGATVYSISGGYINNNPDLQLALNFVPGNNWFIWPQGSKDLDPSRFINPYKPISLSASNLLNSGAQGGTNLANSDLLFTERDGVVKGAWLSLIFNSTATAEMIASIKGGGSKDFRYPYPGFNLSQIGLNWNGFNLSDKNQQIFNLLPDAVQSAILTQYWTSSFPPSAAPDLDINQTNLINIGAHAAANSLSADVIILRSPLNALSAVYSDSLSASNHAFLYKFQHTDIPLSVGRMNMLWPLADSVSSMQPTSAWCNEISLQSLWVPTNMTGAVAGLTVESADQIYKLDPTTFLPTEGAWLKGASINNLYEDPNLVLPVYNRDATFCAEWLDGPIQPSLSLYIQPGNIQSFIWMDQDTLADKVFAFVPHKADCPFLLTTGECNCKASQYSPIGHKGDKITEQNGISDFLFADPQGLGANFAINSYVDTRGYNALNSPQFSFFNLTSAATDPIGWGPGSWKTGNGTPLVLKTGSRYTYVRTALPPSSKNQSTYFVVFYPYQNILSQYQYEETDVVFLLDFSGSESNNREILISIAAQLIKNLLPKGQTSIQVAGFVFDATVRNLFGFLQQSDIVDYALQSATFNTAPSTNYLLPLSAAVQLLTTNLNPSAYNLCNNVENNILNISGQGGGKPRESALKKIVIIGDGHDTIHTPTSVIETWQDTIKYAPYPIQVFSIALGPESQDSNVLQNIASPLTNYIDLQSVIINQEVSLNVYAQQIAQQIGNRPIIFPVWQKSININGKWIDTGVATDLILRPGDNIQYQHTLGPSYSSQPINGNPSSFLQDATSFKLKIKLNGWDYDTARYDSLNIGSHFGCRPFWGKAYNTPDLVNNFHKETAYLGGHIRFFDDYIPLAHPEISDLVLVNDSWIQYSRKSPKSLSWKQPLVLNVSEGELGWLNLKLDTTITNLSTMFLVAPLDKVVTLTKDPTDIVLESYTDYSLNRYNYWAQKSFAYTESLFIDPACASLSPISTAIFISPVRPWANLENIHFPTIASVSPANNLKNQKELGYLTPSNLGTSRYLGKGYTMNLNISALSGWQGEPLFWDLNTYGPRNRGLSQKDQLTPVYIHNIDNSWLAAPATAGLLSGTIINARHYQKMIPYQSDVETNGFCSFGLSRAEDYDLFWKTFTLPTTADFNQAILPLLADVGTLTHWAQDIFGNEYGILKS